MVSYFSSVILQGIIGFLSIFQQEEVPRRLLVQMVSNLKQFDLPSLQKPFLTSTTVDQYVKIDTKLDCIRSVITQLFASPLWKSLRRIYEQNLFFQDRWRFYFILKQKEAFFPIREILNWLKRSVKWWHSTVFFLPLNCMEWSWRKEWNENLQKAKEPFHS